MKTTFLSLTLTILFSANLYAASGTVNPMEIQFSYNSKELVVKNISEIRCEGRDFTFPYPETRSEHKKVPFEVTTEENGGETIMTTTLNKKFKFSNTQRLLRRKKCYVSFRLIIEDLRYFDNYGTTTPRTCHYPISHIYVYKSSPKEKRSELRLEHLKELTNAKLTIEYIHVGEDSMQPIVYAENENGEKTKIGKGSWVNFNPDTNLPYERCED
jgi:hypothetical protein